MAKDDKQTTSPNHAMRGRLGGLTTSSRHDPREYTQQARRGFLARFEREVDPECKLAPEERTRRAQAALSAHMTRLALKSGKVRKGASKGKR